jgi:hypothetical protein
LTHVICAVDAAELTIAYRHFAAIGALTIIGVSLGYEFFVQQLVTLPTGWWADNPPSYISPTDHNVQTFEQQLKAYDSSNQTGSQPPLPAKLQVARIANATNYTYPDIGEPPCELCNCPPKGICDDRDPVTVTQELVCSSL